MNYIQNNPETKSKHDNNLEALRGFAAMVVVVFHLIIDSNYFNGGYGFRNVVSFCPSGHLMVMIFFMLSGYVIGKSYSNKPDFNGLDYMKKRLVRLYPIYLFSILFTIILMKDNFQTIVCNLFFLQNIFSNCFKNNESLWSLNHEIVYYLFAILLLKYKVNSKYLFIIFSILLIATFRITTIPYVIQAYLAGFLFWLTGYMLSSLKKDENYKLESNKLISVMFLLLGGDLLNMTARLFAMVHYPIQIKLFNMDDMVRIDDFDLFPLALYAIITFSSVKFKYFKALTWFVYINSIVHLINLLLNHKYFNNRTFFLPTFCISMSLIFYFMKPFKFNIQRLVYLGSISYAIYVIHTPMIFAFDNITFFTGTTLSYFVRILIFLALLLPLAIFLEKKFQPFIKRFLL